MVKISREQAKKCNLATFDKFFGLEIANYYLEAWDRALDGRVLSLLYYARLKLPVYILLFIPLHVASFLWCIWDGGIKYFRFYDNETERRCIVRSGDNYYDVVELYKSMGG